MERAAGCAPFILTWQVWGLVAEPERILLMYLDLGIPSYPWTSWGANHVNTVGSGCTAKPWRRWWWGPSEFLGELDISKL